MYPPLPPLLIVSRNGDFDRSVTRARVLRAGRDQGVVEVDPASIDIERLEAVLADHVLETPVRVVFLIGDLDTGGAQVDGLVDEAAVLLRTLRSEFPATSFRLWFVLRSGKDIGPVELALAAEAEGRVRSVPFAATVIFTSSVGAAQFVPPLVVDRQIGDLLHLVAASDLEAELTRTGTRTWALGIGSVVYRPDGLVGGAMRSIDLDLERMTEPRSGDPAHAQGSRWADERGLRLPRPGDGGDDSEQRLLLAGPGRGSLVEAPARELRRLDATIDGVDPGLWAGLIAAEVDVATAPRTDPGSGERSALVVALDQVDANVERRRAELVTDLEAQARQILREQRSISSADEWCEGARAAIQASIDDLVKQEPDEPADLLSSYKKLSNAAGRLPYSSSLLVRGLLIVVLVAVLGYVYAPIGTFVAWAFSKRVFWLGDSLEENARAWARVTAVITGTGLWIWWEALWRRVRRFRRQYVKAASEQIARMVEEHARRRRIEMLRELLEAIGDPSGPVGSLRWWLRSNLDAVTRIRNAVDFDLAAGEAVAEDRWSSVIPAAGDPGRVIEDLTSDELARLGERALDVIGSSPLDRTAEDAQAAIERAVSDAIPGGGRDLAEHWASVDGIGDASRTALTAPLWAGLPETLAARRGVTRAQIFVAPSNVVPILDALLTGTPSVGCTDPDFVANLWATPVFTEADREPDVPDDAEDRR